MTDRPVLNKNLDGVTFQSYYYLKEELVAFCKQEGLQTIGGKIDITKRIPHYLDTGERLATNDKPKSKPTSNIGSITEDRWII